MPDYIYIDPLGNMIESNYQDTPQAAIDYARELAADHQVSRICIAEVVDYRVTIPQCRVCHKYFSTPVYEVLWPTCPACDTEPTCPHCGSEEIDFINFICTKCQKEIN